MTQDDLIVIRRADLPDHANVTDVVALARMLDTPPPAAHLRLAPAAWRITWPDGRASNWRSTPVRRLVPSDGRGATVQLAYTLEASHG